MGANFWSCVLKGNDKKIIEEWNEMVEEDYFMNGHDTYSGGIGTMGKGLNVIYRTFPSEDAAEKYIEEKHDKWGRAMAVSIGEDEWIVGGWCAE